MPTPAELAAWTKSQKGWGKYRKLLEELADKQLDRQNKAFLLKSASKSEKFFIKNIDRFVEEQMLMIEAAMNAPTQAVFEAMAAEQSAWIARKYPSLDLSFGGGLDAISARVVATNTVDTGKAIGKHLGAAGRNLKVGLREADKLIRLGELTGEGVERIVKDIRRDVLGLKPYQRAAAMTGDIRTTVRTALGDTAYDVSHKFGKANPEIIGEKIRRGPGPCDGQCDILGVPEGGLGVFVYGKNDPPGLLLHHNSYAAVEGYVFQRDTDLIDQAAKWKPPKHLEKAYSEFTRSRTIGRKYLSRHWSGTKGLRTKV